ncbi:MAG TPA: hypothetical protein VH112_13085, partial [Acidimicrobiales bacterium]|nr:hypothetical protein [Acidimicrobiales bacterium]
LSDAPVKVVDILEGHEGDRDVCDRLREREGGGVGNHGYLRVVVGCGQSSQGGRGIDGEHAMAACHQGTADPALPAPHIDRQ